MSKSKYRPKNNFNSTPMWWNHLYCEKPNRAKSKKLERAVLKDPEIADGLVWPHPKKPHVYYW